MSLPTIACTTLLALLCTMGCYAATRSTVDLVKVEQKVAQAKAADAQRRAVYAWTMADAYIKKARDEWGHSDYEAAEKMMKQAEAWADKAIAEAATAPIDARANPPADSVQTAPPAPQTTSQGVWQ